MKLVVWDSSSKAGTIAALEWASSGVSSWSDVRLIAEFSLNVEATHSERLLWAIHQVLEAARWNIKDVDVFGVGVGPGSFTGLRIGLTTARTLAQCLNKPIVGVSSLLALAHPAAMHFLDGTTSQSTLVIACTNACKGELFARWSVPHLLESAEDQVMRPVDLIASLKKDLCLIESSLRETEPSWLVLGEGRNQYPAEWDTLSEFKEISNKELFVNHIQGRYLGQLVWKALKAGVGKENLDILPRYLRLSDAELKLRAGLLKGSGTEQKQRKTIG
jgi:tRNA threonylcarbamoyladenosine biosynthesis protein TsaB